MVDVEAQWRMRLELVVENLVREQREHREIASLSEQIEADYHGRFLIELLQNANDSVVSSGQADLSVLVVRTEHLLAVLNQGKPFDHKGLKDITSIGLSSKTPERFLGNKGVGFKAVFEVSQSPEIFSAPREGGSLTDPGGTRFRLDLKPLSKQSSRETARRMISDILTNKDTHLTVEEVWSETLHAAPFKFPLSLTFDELEARLSTLGIEADLAQRFQSMVLLPLKQDSTRAVDRAFRALVDDFGATLLFLDGVARIEIRDSHHDIWCELGREELASPEILDRAVRLEQVRTWKKRGEGLRDGTVPPESVTQEEMTWWKIGRNVGSPAGVDAQTHERERQHLQQALSSLPGERWDEVESVPVAVALPRGRPSEPPGSPLGIDGLFCIGLPTQQPTGMPFWIHSHFHGNISRTEIDLESQTYNQLLFEEGIRLVETLVDRLRRASGIQDRRLVTLAMEMSEGPAGQWIAENHNIRTDEIVLAADGSSYLKPVDLTVPPEEDLQMLQLLLGSDASPSDYGFVLPEEGLLTHARVVLQGLAGEDLTEGWESLFVRRKAPGPSLLERAAERHRSDGPEFWSPYLKWAARQFTLEQLGSQRILPVGRSALHAPDRRVFFRPDPESEDIVVDELSGSTASIPDLPLFDDRAMPVRKEGGGYTEMAKVLAPEDGRGLVHRPRVPELINDVLVPYMDQALDDASDEAVVLATLRTILKLTDRIASDETRDRIQRERLRVPCEARDAKWRWIPSTDAYFGAGWTDPETDSLLDQAYGGQDRRLIPWATFERSMGVEDGKEPWVRRMKALGVHETPKLRKAPANRKAPLYSADYESLTRDESVSSPFPDLDDIWSAYLESIRDRPSKTTSGQRFDVDELLWVDGLENPEGRDAVVALILRNPRPYMDATETVLGRTRLAKDRTPVPTMWVHALRTSGWEVIPTSQGFVAPTDAWLGPAGPRAGIRERYKLLPMISERFRSRQAEALLEELGVQVLEDATADQLVDALHVVAQRLPALASEEKRDAEILAKDLYADIQSALHSDEETGLDRILERPVPLLRHGIEAIDLSEADVIYLDDDPIRGRFVPELGDSPRVPTRAGRTYGRLVGDLRRVLGGDRVRVTSTAPVETGFQPEVRSDLPLLVDELGAAFPDRNIHLEVAAILAHLGRDPLDPAGDRFQELWSDFERTRLQRGTFPAEGMLAFLERSGSEEPVLQLSTSADSQVMLESIWQVLGQTHRDVIALYSQKVSAGDDMTEFFETRNVGSQEFRMLQEVVTGTAVAELEKAEAWALALMRQEEAGFSVQDFQKIWDPAELAEKRPDHVFGVPIDDLRSFGRAALLHDEASLSALLSEAGVDVAEWQDARADLGTPPWRFETAVRAYRKAREQLVAEIMAVSARRSSVDSSEVEEVVGELRNVAGPADVTHQPPSKDGIRKSVVTAALSVAEERLDGDDNLLVRRLKAELISGDTFVPDDIPDREVSDFRHTPSAMRARRARAFLTEIVDVASDLAEAKGEHLHRESVLEDPRILELTEGWLASHYALAPVLREKLAEFVPETARDMTDKGVFRERIPKAELQRLFPGVAGGGSEGPTPQPPVSLFGESWTNQKIHDDLALASQGELGSRIRTMAQEEVDLRGLASRQRKVVSPSTGTRSPSRPDKRGGDTGDHEGSRREREINGLLGEIFVFEKFRQQLPGFDSTCWISENRVQYGHDDPGSDEEGYDFLYVDVDGELTPKKGVVCEIEVKATSLAEAEEFRLTRNEMNRARACHTDEDREYVIVWVAEVREVPPKIHDVLVDPVGLWEQRLLDITPRGDLRVRVPEPDGPEE